MRSINNDWYRKPEWRRVEKAYKDYAGGLCEECLKHGRYTAGVIVHHIKHLNPHNVEIPEIAYGFDNLELVCIECHNALHGRGHTERRYTINPDGSINTIADSLPSKNSRND